MSRPLVLLLLSILFASTVFGMGSKKPQPPTTPVEVEAPQANESLQVSVKLKIVGTTAQVSRLSKFRDPIERILNSEKFKKRILGAWYAGKAQFVSTTLTNAQVYDAIIKANELGSGDDHVAYMQVGLAKARCSTLGWTTPSDPMFYFNTCSFDERTDAGLAGTLCHEWVHKLGFDHDSRRTARREYSVPYAVGTICAELYPEFAQNLP